MIERFLGAIQTATTEGLATEQQSVLTGFSGERLIGSLQRLTREISRLDNTCYLEIGVFQGLTLLSVAAANPSLPCYGIDNFAYFDPEGKNLGLVNDRRELLAARNAHVINLDYEAALANLSTHIQSRKVGVLFVDGPHDYRSQLMCLVLALPYMHDESVIVVDDCNYRHVRQANRDFLITHPDYALLFEAYTKCHPSNMSKPDVDQARRGWWNGVNILVRDPRRALTRMYPPTHAQRSLYENEHIIHAADVSEHTVQALRVAQMLDERRWMDLARALVHLAKTMKATRAERRGLFRYSNTYSDGLRARFCERSPGGMETTSGGAGGTS